ncbi:MAG: type III secretion system export apparatus subunit SctU [Pseudomonadota bacterium]
MNEKTEDPTPKKLRDARKKGQVAKSKEVSSAALLITVFGLLISLMGTFVEDLTHMIEAPASLYEADFELALDTMLQVVMKTMIAIVVPIVAAVAAVGVISNMAQFGFLMSPEAIMPKFNKLNPASGIKKIISLNNLVEFIKSFAKIVFLSVLLYLIIRGAIHDLVKIPYCGKECIPPMLTKLLVNVIIYTVAAFVIIAFADYVYQIYSFNKQNKMTKDEVKREYKESEGDPHIKSHRKHFHQEMLMSDMDESVRKSKVIVTNPTHIAVALDYREDETPLPIVRAMGQNLIAERIKRIAEEEGIPIMQNVQLARGLYEEGDVNQYIPTDFIKPVAAVLRWVREQERERG